MKNQQEEQLSPEQLEARREEMKAFYESSISYLEAQAKYEKLLTEVEEARYKRATMQLQYASMMAAAQPMDEDDEDDLPMEPQAKPAAQAPATGSKKLKRG